MRPLVPRRKASNLCPLIKTNDGLVLVDCGFGRKDYTNPAPFMWLFLTLVRSPRRLEDTAIHRLQHLGYDPKDVKHIVISHMHLDHTGGLPDFPHAQVHLFRTEYQAARRPKGFKGLFYLHEHWAHQPKWVLHDLSGEKWFDFECMTIIEGLKPRILLVPLCGHTPGHCGVAIETTNGWLFFCGDAASSFYTISDPNQDHRKKTPGVVNWLLGPHIPSLRAFALAHQDQVHLLGALADDS